MTPYFIFFKKGKNVKKYTPRSPTNSSFVSSVKLIARGWENPSINTLSTNNSPSGLGEIATPCGLAIAPPGPGELKKMNLKNFFFDKQIQI